MQQTQHDLTDDQTDRAANGRRRLPPAGFACSTKPGPVAGSGGGVEAIAARPADPESGAGVPGPDRVEPDDLDVEVKPAKSTDRPGQSKVGGALEVD